MQTQTDVLVIGSGLAGFMAAAREKELGKSVICAAKSVGLTGFSSGAFNHSVSKFTEPLKFISAESNKNLLIASQFGDLKICKSVQASQYFDLNKISKDTQIAVISFTGLPQFCAESVSLMLNFNKINTEFINLDIKPQNKHKAIWSSLLDFAKDFKLNSDQIYSEINKLSKTKNYTHYFVPPCMGLEIPDFSGIKISLSELLGESHSIPGLRLSNILLKNTQKELAIDFTRENSKISSVIFKSGLEIKADKIILATGRYFSGGFASKPQLKESLFGLDLVGTDIFNMKLNIDKLQRPLDRFGNVFAENLFAAGSNIC